MANSDKNIARFDFAPDLLLKVLTDPEYHIARAKSQQAIEATVEEISRTDQRLVFDVHSTEYAKSVTGVDKSKTEKTRTNYDWDLQAKKSKWTYYGSQGERVKVTGNLSIEPDGAKSKVTSIFNVEVKIPLLGGKIEKMVIKEVKKSWPSYERVIREFCEKMAKA